MQILKTVLGATAATVVGLTFGACAAPAVEPTAVPTAQPSATALAGQATTPARNTPTAVPMGTPLTTDGDLNRYRDLLHVVPDTAENRSAVFINDITGARKIFGIADPDMSSGAEGFLRYAHSFFTVDGTRFVEMPWLTGFQDGSLEAPISQERRRYLGFDLRDVDRTIVLAAVEPRQQEILYGRFDPDATERALEACAECAQPQRPDHRGVRFYSWGEDFATDVARQMAPPIFDRFGRGGRLVVQKDVVFRAVYTEGVTELIDAQTGAVPSLADTEYRLLAVAMAQLDAYGMLLSDQTQWAQAEGDARIGGRISITPETRAAMRTVADQGPLLKRYALVGIGAGRDQRGDYLAIALVHETARDAADNVPLLHQRIAMTESLHPRGRRPWKEIVSHADVQANGHILQAKLYGAERYAGLYAQWFLAGDPLLVHE